LWYHHSHVISPLAERTSEKAKWAWGTKHKEAFQWISNTIARQLLLKYPDFQNLSISILAMNALLQTLIYNLKRLFSLEIT
jgi:hypothetical protein